MARIALCFVTAVAMASAASAQSSSGTAWPPAGATGLCNNGEYVYVQEKRGSCRGKQGIKEWFADGGRVKPEQGVEVAAAAPAPRPEPIVLQAGQSVDLGAVYWAEGCTSNLLTIVGIDMLDGPPGLKLSVRKEDVVPATPGCAKVPGGVVVATIDSVTRAEVVSIKYRVRYRSLNGPRQSESVKELALKP